MSKPPRPPLNPLHGWINLHKPIGMSSADAVFHVKRLLRPTKIGHAGTLDPLATGVLPLALGEATKCISLLMDARKTYEFEVTFGERRNTDDAEGEVVATSNVIPGAAEIAAILPRFTGDILQMPPAYSALKINGKRAYALARAGEEVTLAARPVTVYALEMLGVAPPPPEREGALPMPRILQSARFRTTVSKGTYIRSLGRDIAQALGSEGYISHLHRASVGAFTDADAISLDFLRETGHKAAELNPRDWLLPLRAVLDDIPALALNGQQWQTLRFGQRVDFPYPDTPLVALLAGESLMGLAEVINHQIITRRLLNL